MAAFRNAYTSLLLVIAGSTERALARQVAYLKAENQILRRRLPRRISLTDREKSRLVRFAKNLGGALDQLTSIVHPGTPSTYEPNQNWVVAQADAFRDFARVHKLPCSILMHDRDAKFTREFDRKFQGKYTQTLLASYRSPNLCAYVERFIQSLQQECLDYFVVFGRRHFDYLTGQYVEHYTTERPHQGLDNQIPGHAFRSPKQTAPIDLNRSSSWREIQCRERLGGLLKHYHRAA